jgi:hypothetical protein
VCITISLLAAVDRLEQTRLQELMDLTLYLHSQQPLVAAEVRMITRLGVAVDQAAELEHLLADLMLEEPQLKETVAELPVSEMPEELFPAHQIHILPLAAGVPEDQQVRLQRAGLPQQMVGLGVLGLSIA